MGTGHVLQDTAEALVLAVNATQPPPPRAGISLILAVPRPKQLKRIIPAVASLGIDRVMLVGAARVERSYFDSKVLSPSFLEELLHLGLEQACDTVRPSVGIAERLESFLLNQLSPWAPKQAPRLVPHPSAPLPLRPVAASQHVILAIGPDGGWIPSEVETFETAGFTSVSMGQRVLRTEVAVPTILGTVRAAG